MARGRPPGARNKRTLVREQRVQLALKASRNEAKVSHVVVYDSLTVMETVMKYFFERFKEEREKKKPNRKEIEAAGRDAFAMAKEIAPYYRAKFATIKIANDPNANKLSELTRDELRKRIVEKATELGIFIPVPDKQNGAANR